MLLTVTTFRSHPTTSQPPKWAQPSPTATKAIRLSRALSRPVLGYGPYRRPLLRGPSLRARSDVVSRNKSTADHTRRVKRQGVPTCVILSFSDNSGPGNRTPDRSYAVTVAKLLSLGQSMARVTTIANLHPKLTSPKPGRSVSYALQKPQHGGQPLQERLRLYFL